jgi:hypothetical protein
MNLFINYFNHPNGLRAKEIDEALRLNVANEHIKRILIIGDEPKIKSDKIDMVEGERPTYQDFFDLTEYYPDDINIISNSDISFDDTIHLAENLNPREAYALTRHEFSEGKILDFTAYNNCPPHFSQDTWIFKGAVKVKNVSEVIAMNNITRGFETIPFHLGVPGCDNVIAHYIKLFYGLKNPYDYIIARHHHGSRKRPEYPYRVTGAKSHWGVITKVPITRL